MPAAIGPQLRGALRRLRFLVAELLITMHAFGVLIVVELLLRRTTLPRVSRALGVTVNLEPSPSNVDRLEVSELTPRVRRRLRCSWRAADLWPFSHGPCLRRALVGGYLIRDLHPSIGIGLAGAGETMQAHAWLEINDRPLETTSGYGRFQRSMPGDGS